MRIRIALSGRSRVSKLFTVWRGNDRKTGTDVNEKLREVYRSNYVMGVSSQLTYVKIVTRKFRGPTRKRGILFINFFLVRGVSCLGSQSEHLASRNSE